MGNRNTTPTGIERHFDADEVIVSKTDPQGLILYANEVFMRVSGYREEDLLGQPHSIIRHPDMPRAVFKLLWDTLGGGDEIFAYVLNLCRNGDHYWVLAHVTPSYDARGTLLGFHSNRRTPSREAIAVVQPIYAQLLAEEQRHERKLDAVAASTALLGRVLADGGLTYPEFVWSLATTGKQRTAA